MIATQFTTRAKLLKGDLLQSGPEMTRGVLKRPPPGLPLPVVARPRFPPPGFPVLPQFGTQGGMAICQGDGKGGVVANGKIVDAVTQLSASIVGCHRETVTRETGLECCPSSNQHHFVPQKPHSRHEFDPTSKKATVKNGNN